MLSSGVALAKERKKVLLIDADPQGNLTTCLGYNKLEEMPIQLTEIVNAEMMDEELNIKDGTLHHEEGIDLIPLLLLGFQPKSRHQRLLFHRRHGFRSHMILHPQKGHYHQKHRKLSRPSQK